MKDILAKSRRPLIEAFARSQTLLAFDFDGTLAPIVDDPRMAILRPATRDLLARVAALYPCVVISGRALSDVARRVHGVGLRSVVGNHGIEPWRATKRIHRRVQDWRPLFSAALDGEAGVEIEDKTYSLAIHFRRSRAKKRVRDRVLTVAAELEEVRVIGGIEVVNIVPADAPHKGIALERDRSRFHCDTAIYVGDDETDEDVFALDQPGRLLAIRVGQKAASRANYYVKSQEHIDALLSVLAGLRERMRQAGDLNTLPERTR